MSEGANQPQQPRGTPSSTSVPRAQTNPNQRVMSATRTAPLPKEQQQAALKERLKSESANVALNTLSIVKEKVQEFREQDQFFKYKAFIASGWLLLSVSTFGITCARGAKQTGDFGAKLVAIPARSSVSILNKSEEPWASVASVQPMKEVTISPKQLLGSAGQAAPSDIAIQGLEMRTSEGRAVLLQDGQNLTEDAQ
jgi:hypothetical protein